ncbi:MAG: ArdC-like ssDNA-binding domain-containing protein [Dehalogenimonas sp.]
MAGQVRLIIKNKEWVAAVAISPWELTQGLSGIPVLTSQTGMLFDLGYLRIVEVTTEPMLFPLDIAFLSESFTVTEIYRDVSPSYLVTSAAPARYFLEVNAGELGGIEVGDVAGADWLVLAEAPPVAPDWAIAIASFGGVLVLGSVMVGLSRHLGDMVFGSQEPELLPAASRASDKCEIVYPRNYDLVSWVGAPVPDYSFSIEPEAKERRIDEVLKKLKDSVDGIQQSENFRNFLLTMSKFHDYSIGNLMLIAVQRPDATRVAGFNTWKDLYRWVKKGEKGIAILAPCLPPKSARMTEPSRTTDEKQGDAEEEKREMLRPIYFKVVYVFDVSQTEGKPLPEFEVPVLTGEANEELFDNILHLVRIQGVSVGFDSRPHQDPAIKGYFSGKEIWVRPEEPRAQQLKTLIHEVAHYYTEGVFHTPRRDAETIAESAAFAVGAHFGFDSGARSFPYVALWARDKKVLEQNLASIRQVTGRIIEGIDSLAKKPAGVA